MAGDAFVAVAAARQGGFSSHVLPSAQPFQLNSVYVLYPKVAPSFESGLAANPETDTLRARQPVLFSSGFESPNAYDIWSSPGVTYSASGAPFGAAFVGNAGASPVVNVNSGGPAINFLGGPPSEVPVVLPLFEYKGISGVTVEMDVQGEINGLSLLFANPSNGNTTGFINYQIQAGFVVSTTTAVGGGLGVQMVPTLGVNDWQQPSTIPSKNKWMRLAFSLDFQAKTVYFAIDNHIMPAVPIVEGADSIFDSGDVNIWVWGGAVHQSIPFELAAISAIRVSPQPLFTTAYTPGRIHP